MAFSTYAQLNAAIADQLARSDLTSQIPDFITLFEAYAARRLKVRPQETAVVLSTTLGVATLPTDYIGWRSVIWAGDPFNPLSYLAFEEFVGMFPTVSAGTPLVFTITGSDLVVAPYDDASGLAFDYFAKSAALSSALNWLFTKHPDAYYAGSLAEAYAFLKDYEQAAVWKARRDEEFDEISKLNFREQGNMAIRVYGQTP